MTTTEPTTSAPRHMGETREIRAVEYPPKRLAAGELPDPEPRLPLTARAVTLWHEAVRVGAGLPRWALIVIGVAAGVVGVLGAATVGAVIMGALGATA